MQLKSKSALAGGVLAAVMVPAAGASAASFRGAVVHQNPRAHSFVLTGAGGRLTAIHAGHLPAVGRTVTVTARQLRNGTWRATRVRVGRAATHVRIRGTVTYVNSARHVFVLSARGSSLLVHARSSLRHTLRAASDTGMQVGQIVSVEGELNHDSVDATQVQITGGQTSGISLEGTVQAIDTAARTLTVSADDNGQSGAAVTVHVPDSFDLGAFTVGEPVELSATPNADGTYTLEQSSDDTNAAHADNLEQIQGDDHHGAAQANAQQQCSAQSTDTAFPSSHGGLTFTQFYQRNPSDAGNAFGRCVNQIAHHGDGQNPTDSESHKGSAGASSPESSPSDGSHSGHRGSA
jgi:uncharacterized Zn finger protein